MTNAGCTARSPAQRRVPAGARRAISYQFYPPPLLRREYRHSSRMLRGRLSVLENSTLPASSSN